MPLPNQPWSTSLPGAQDTVGSEQPDLSNDSAPGANDGHRVLVEHLHALRDKAQYLSTTVGDGSSLPAGCLKARVTALEGAPSTDVNVKADGTDTTAGNLTAKLDTPATGITKTVVDLGGGNRQVQLALNFGSGAGRPVEDTDGRLTDARTPLAHTASHKHGGADEVATATPAANAIPKAGAGGDLDGGWMPYGTGANTVCQGNDSRLSDARTPTSHAASHQDGGGDEISVANLSGKLADDQNAEAIRTTTGPTLLTVGAIADGQFLKRSGTTVIGDAAGSASPLTTKGDIYTYDTGDQRLPVGANGTVLTADSAEATGVKWATPAAGGGGFDREEFYTATAPDGSGRQTFTLAASAAVNANVPAGYSVRVYVNGLKHKYVTPPGAREFDVTSPTQIRVGGLNLNDDVEIVYGV